MAKNKKYKTYRRRHNDVKISMFPNWLDRMMSVFKVFIYVMPIISCSIAMLLAESNLLLSNQWIMTALWCLSLQLITQLPDAK